MALAREAQQPRWWEQYDLTSLATHIGLETEEVWVSTYSLVVVPELLRTESYARAILEVGEPRIEALIRRQKPLTMHDGLFTRCIVDEAALRRSVGGMVTVQDQIARIIEAASSRKATSQIIPFDVGLYPGFGSSFTFLQFASPTMNDVVCIRGVSANSYLECPTELEDANKSSVDCYP